MELTELEDMDFDDIVKNHEENNINTNELDLNVSELVINLDENDDILDYDVIYSYPYYRDNSHDYQFRITIQNDNYELEEIKAETNEISDKDLNILKNYGKNTVTQLIECLENSIDIRNGNHLPNLEKEGGFVDFDIDPADSVTLKKKIEMNKQIVLKEMYQQIIEANN